MINKIPPFPFRVIVFYLLFTTIALGQSQRTVSFSFSLGSPARTSAGVFTKDGTLIRTLWSGVSFPAGSTTKSWDGLDDNGQTAPDASYDVRMLSNNVTYTWEGVIGNTSFGVSSGNAIQRAFLRMHSMAITGNNAYYGVGYAEGNPSQAKFALTSPQQRVEFSPKGNTAQATLFVATDGNIVYWAGYDGYSNGNKWFIYGTKISDDSEQSFPTGQPVAMVINNKTYASCIDVMDGMNSVITGLAVQKNGNYLFISHKARHEIRVLNKTTGALVQTLFFNDATGLTVDGQDNLWVINGNTVSKYAVQANGTLSSSLLTLNGLQVPMALAVSPDNNTVLMADGGSSQQVKAFSNATGAAVWTLGQAGGYMKSPDVTNDKFYFSDSSRIINDTFIAFAPDGSFWIGDSGNYRAQHYSASQSFIDRIMYLQNNYSCFVDQNNPSRVFGQYLEFAIDYTKPLEASNGSWTLVKNWRASIPSAYFETPTYNNIFINDIFRDVVTMRNGRVYGFLRRYSDNKWVLVELPPNGPVRITGQAFDAQNRYTYHITQDGSLKQSVNNYNGTAGTIDWQNRPLSGFDGNNDPIWGPPAPYATAPVTNGQEPVSWHGGHERTGETTSSNVMITFDENKVNGAMGNGYHLGGIRVSDNKWLWKTAHATSVDYKGAYPNDGAYDVGNEVEYGGGGISVLDRNIFWNYFGEFWKGSQTNKWQHVYDNGLLVGVFGKTAIEARQESPDGGAVAGMAGNVFFGTAVKAPNGNVYIYHGEESGWSGIHRWRVDGLNSIQEQIIPLQSLSIAPASDPSGADGLDLLSGLSRNSTVQNGTAGWTRNPGNDFNNAYNDKWMLKTSILGYDRFNGPDLYASFSKSGSTYTVARDLGTTTNLTTWSMKGVITFDGTNPNNGTPGESDSGGCYFDVLDDNGKVLARIYNQVYFGSTSSPVKLYGNSQVIAQGDYFNPATATGTQADAIDISMAEGKLTIKYGNYAPITTRALEAGGNLQKPKTLRLLFWGNGRNYERTIDIISLRFFSTTSPPIVSQPLLTPAVPSGSTYFVKAKHSGRYFDVDGASTADGAFVKQWEYNGGKNQQWQLTSLNNGYYSFKSTNSGKFLSVVDGSRAEGALTHQMPANNQTNQQFKLVDVGGGYFQIIAGNSQKCLTVQDAQTGNGPSIQQNSCGTGDQQKFLLTDINSSTTPPPAPAPAVPSGKTYFVKAKHSGRYFDVSSASTADGAFIKQWEYNGGKNQQWQLTSLNNGYYSFKSTNSGKFLSVVDGSRAEGALTHQMPANNQTNQQFKLVDVGGGYFQIIAGNSQKCLTVQDAQIGNGPSIQQNSCGNGDNQKFLLADVNSPNGRLATIDYMPGEPGILVYPNPTANQITINGAKDAYITLTDELGRVRLTYACETDSSTVSVSSLPAGTYIIQIRKGTDIISKKIIVNNLR